MADVQKRQLSKEETDNMKGIVTFDFDVWKDKETSIENVFIMQSEKEPMYKGASNKFLVVETKSLGVHSSKKDNIEREIEIKAAESFSVIEQDGKITGWPMSGKLQQLLDLVGKKNPHELVGLKVRSAKKQNRSKRIYLGWNPI